MFKFLKGVVAGSGTGLKDLPYNIGDPYPSAWGSWNHFRGTSKDDGSPVSIFSLTGNNAQDGHLAAGRNGVKRLRTVRHPNILSFLHSTEVETHDGSTTKVTIYIVTEPVMPLADKIKELGLKATQRDEYFALGLHQIAKAVSFLNNDCKLVHGNVCLASVVVTPTLDWKLHAFDVLSEFDGSNESASGPMLPFEWLVGTQYKPMEMVKSDWVAIRKSPAWAIDSWGLGCLIYELFSGSKLGKTEELRNTVGIPKSLLPDYQRLLSSMPSRRLNTSKLLENGEYFQNKLVDTIHFMDILNLKDSVEKDTFFRKLPNIAEQLPREIVLKKLLPLLASSLEFGSAAAPALTALLKMGSWLSTEDFSVKVLPTIVKLFASNDRAIRVSLLQHVDQFGESMSGQIVDEQVYPHVATGFADTSAFLRELTLKSMLVLAPKHVGGPKSNAQHQLEMSEKEGREVSIAEVFIKTHTRKDGTYVDEKAKRIGESYEQNLIQATHSDLDIDVPMASDGASQAPNPTREQLDDIFLKSTSFDARGNPYGLGSLSQVYKKGKKNPEVIPSSSSITVLVQKLNETESKLAEQVEHNKAQVSLMMKYLKEKDPALPEWVLTATAQGNINQDPNLKPSEGEDDIAS